MSAFINIILNANMKIQKQGRLLLFIQCINFLGLTLPLFLPLGWCERNQIQFGM